MKPDNSEIIEGADKPFPWRCGECGRREMRPTRVEHTAEILYEGTVLPVRVADLAVVRCSSCESWVNSVEGERQVFQEAQRLLDLLQAPEIRRLQRMLGITSRDLAQLVGADETSVLRWTDGKEIQSREMDRRLRDRLFDALLDLSNADRISIRPIQPIGGFASAPSAGRMVTGFADDEDS